MSATSTSTAEQRGLLVLVAVQYNTYLDTGTSTYSYWQYISPSTVLVLVQIHASGTRTLMLAGERQLPELRMPNGE
eukprot:scaffold399264_cov17-Prasinocladus_malaysianus.AAC.1